MNAIDLNSTYAAARESSPYLSVPNSANDPYGFLSDLATATLADELGGTPIYQSGNQSGTGPCTMPNWNQIRLADGTLIGAGAAQYNIDLVGIDRYKEQLAALQNENAATGYTDPALNVPEADRYTGVKAKLVPVLADAPAAIISPPQQAAAEVATNSESRCEVPSAESLDEAVAAPHRAEEAARRESLVAYAYSALAESAQLLGIEK